jgi:hypothetical protein
MMQSETDLKRIFRKFDADGTFKSAGPYGSGHINDTYRILTRPDDSWDYILQRINHQIFKNVPKLQENILRVTRHLRNKLEAIPGSEPDRETLTLIPGPGQLPYYHDADGNYWRLYIFIRDNKSYNRVQVPAQAYEGGKAFGRFQKLISDLEGPPLFETIPHFHDMVRRLDSFYGVVRRDPLNRTGKAREEIAFVEQRAVEMTKIQELGRAGLIPERITHNDTKFNNVLLDLNDKGLCVIDLDTVMPGFIHYDFGDAIRTSTNTANEDETDIGKVTMDMTLFKSFSTGFLAETGFLMNQSEIQYLAFSSRVMTFIIGLRFLTDHLDGDHYFKVQKEDHNLTRARTQFKLVRSMEDQAREMEDTIYGIMDGLVHKATP